MFCLSQIVGFNNEEPGSAPGWGWQCSLKSLCLHMIQGYSRQSGADSAFQPGSVSIHQPHPQPQWAAPQATLNCNVVHCPFLLETLLSESVWSSCQLCLLFPKGHLWWQPTHMPRLSPYPVEPLPWCHFWAIYCLFPCVRGLLFACLFHNLTHFEQWMKVPSEKARIYSKHSTLELYAPEAIKR